MYLDYAIVFSFAQFHFCHFMLSSVFFQFLICQIVYYMKRKRASMKFLFIISIIYQLFMKSKLSLLYFLIKRAKLESRKLLYFFQEGFDILMLSSKSYCFYILQYTWYTLTLAWLIVVMTSGLPRGG